MSPESSAYCDHCDLPLAHCVHGAPPPPPAPAKAAPKPRRTVTPRASRATAEPPGSTRPSSRVSVKHTARKRTPQKDFRPHLLAILQENGGRLDRDDLLAAVQERLDGVLLDGDREQSETGEVRWHSTVRFERKAMVDDGLLLPAQAGVWQLSPEGSDAAVE